MVICKHIIQLENWVMAGKIQEPPPRFLDAETYQWQYSVWVVGVESRKAEIQSESSLFDYMVDGKF